MNWSTFEPSRLTTGLPTFLITRLSLTVGVALLGSASYFAGLTVYRTYFHPLAGFPGPWLASATYLPEAYHDVWRPGMYIYEIQKMHAKYGLILRVNPNELSIHDPLWYDQLYVGAHVRKTNNYDAFGSNIDLDGSHFITTDHDLHKARRKVLDPFFSRSGMRKIEPLLKSLTVRFEKNLRSHAGQVVRLDHAFVCYSGDVIRSITSEDVKYLMDDSQFSPAWFDLLTRFLKNLYIFWAFPFLIHLVNAIPQSVLEWALPSGSDLRRFQDMARAHIIQAEDDQKDAAAKGSQMRTGHSVFRSMMNSDMPKSELGVDRLTKEAQVLLSAGTLTTGRGLEFISYHILAQPELRTRLGEDLKDIMAGFPNSLPSLVELEQLPLLRATVKEGLRLSFGVMHRLPHCFPDADIPYGKWTIPRNTPIGMSIYLNHTDPNIFPSPFDFNPDRWLGEVDPQMEKAFVPFSKGSRSCLGMNLSFTEIYFTIAALFRPDGPVLQLYETDETDVKPLHDFMLSLPKLDSKGLRVVVS